MRNSLMWSTWQDKAKELLKLPDELFVDAINGALVINRTIINHLDVLWLSQWSCSDITKRGNYFDCSLRFVNALNDVLRGIKREFTSN